MIINIKKDAIIDWCFDINTKITSKKSARMLDKFNHNREKDLDIEVFPQCMRSEVLKYCDIKVHPIETINGNYDESETIHL